MGHSHSFRVMTVRVDRWDSYAGVRIRQTHPPGGETSIRDTGRRGLVPRFAH
jgi:hypothetical protein